MKKTLILLAVALMGLSQFTGFARNLPATSAGENQETPEAGIVLTSIINQAKSEGANWTKDQWKDAILNVFSALKPVGNLISEMTEKIKANPDEAYTLAGKLAEAEQQYAALTPLLEEFEDIAKDYPIAAQLIDDKDFMKEALLKAGITEEAYNFNPESNNDNDNIDDEPSVQSEYDPELLELVTKAETDGANWTEQQWKDAFTVLFKQMVPLMATIKGLEDSNTDDISVLTKTIELMPKLKGTEELMDRLDTAAKANPIGNKVAEDDEFLEQLMRETGFSKFLGDE